MASTKEAKEAKRKAAAERAKRYRENKLKVEDPQAAEELAKKRADEEAKLAEEQRQAMAKEQAEADAKAIAERELTEGLTAALAGTVTVVVAAYNRASGAPKGTPGLKAEQAQTIAALWTPVLAPLLKQYASSILPLMAVTGTMGVLAEYADERDKYIAAQRKQVADE